VQNDGIIGKAKESRQEYELAQGNEQTTLGNYTAKLEENDPKNQSTPETPEQPETPDEPTNEKPTSMTITGADAVKVRNTIQLNVVNENGQALSLENIEWSSSNETVATVNNGTVLGGSLVGGDKGTLEEKHVTITATYKGDDSITATKKVAVCALECSQCLAYGDEVIVGCPECGEKYENKELKHIGHHNENCCSNYDGGYNNIINEYRSDEEWVCPECNGTSYDPMHTITYVEFPCHGLYTDGFGEITLESAEKCSVCAGNRWFYE